MKRFISGVSGLFLLFAPLYSDTVRLKNGDVLTGSIVELNKDTIKIETEYGSFLLKRKFVSEGVFQKSSPPGEPASSPDVMRSAAQALKKALSKALPPEKKPAPEAERRASEAPRLPEAPKSPRSPEVPVPSGADKSLGSSASPAASKPEAPAETKPLGQTPEKKAAAEPPSPDNEDPLSSPNPMASLLKKLKKEASQIDQTINKEETLEKPTPEARPETKPLPRPILFFAFDKNILNLVTKKEAHLPDKPLSYTTDRKGEKDKAAYSEGTGEVLEIPADPSLNKLNNFTLAAWLKVEDRLKTQYLFSKWTSTKGTEANGKAAVYYSRGNLVVFLVDRQRKYHAFRVSNAFPSGVWKHVTVRFRDGILEVFIDGILRKSFSTGIRWLNQDSSPVQLFSAVSGIKPDWNEYNLRGAADDLKLWNQALSDDEIRRLAGE